MIELERMSIGINEWNDTKKLINIYGIAAAIMFLHSKNIIHSDLKPENILMDEELNPKVTDFGLSKEKKKENTDQTQEIKGTPIYVSPEIWENNDYSSAGDVYAFAFIVYEILTGKFVYRDKMYETIMYLVCSKKERPKFHKTFPNCFQQLITKCWSDDPNKRPSFDEIVDELIKNEDFIQRIVAKAFITKQNY